MASSQFGHHHHPQHQQHYYSPYCPYTQSPSFNNQNNAARPMASSQLPINKFGVTKMEAYDNLPLSVEELERQISRDSLIAFDLWKYIDESTTSSSSSSASSSSSPSSSPPMALSSFDVNPANFALAKGNNRECHEAKRERNRPQQCVVCARAANCCHFDVPSCLGCRSFFRRSVLCHRQYQCHRGGSCQIERGEICRSCRLDRCILGGMNARAIRDISLKLNMEGIVAQLEARREELLKRESQREILSGLVKSEPMA